MSKITSSTASQNFEKTTSDKKISWFSWKKIIIFFLITIVLLLFSSIFVIYSFVNNYFQKFESSAGIPVSSLYQQVNQGMNSGQFNRKTNFTILLLGTDQLANRQGDPVLTDTIMLLNLRLDSGELYSLSLPRDLWSQNYQTKINALYQYGYDRYPNSPKLFSKQVVEELTELPIDRTIVISLDQVSELIDILGGVQINVPESFTDEQFPRSDVDIHIEHDPAKLYEVVSFVNGLENMSGERALKYIRSRKSSNVDEGTDDARSKRQQQVISAIIQKVSQPSIILQPKLIGSLYDFYNRNYSQTISLEELVAIANKLRTKLQQIEFSPSSLSIQDDANQGVIIHPPMEKYGQWVYEIIDMEKFQDEVGEKLGIK